MNGHKVIRTRLIGAAGLTALVAQRIYPNVLPDKIVYPAVTYQKLSGSSERGAVSDPALKTAVFQVSAWAKSSMEARSISSQLRIALDRMRKVTVDGVAVDDCFYQDDIDSFDFETRIHFTHTTFKLYYRDPA